MKILQMVPARDLNAAIDTSIDAKIYNLDLDLCMRQKRESCSVKFVRSIKRYGVKMPICVRDFDGWWSLGNGHHRLAVAVELDIDIPVLFVSGEDADDFMHESDTCSSRYLDSEGRKSLY